MPSRGFFPFFSFLMIFVFFGCKKEFSPFCDCGEEVFVYGIINAMDTIHYIKIYKSFMTKQVPEEAARNQDSIYFREEELSGFIEEYDKNGQKTGRIFPLSRQILNNRDPGTFNYPSQVVYAFSARLEYEYTYRLVLNVNSKNLKKTVYAQTKIPPRVTLSFIGAPATSGEIIFSTPTELTSTTVKWENIKEAGMYELRLRFYYYDTIQNSGKYRRSIEYSSGVMVREEGVPEISRALTGADFYSQVYSQVPIPSSITGLVSRIPDSVYVILWVTDKELLKYKRSLDASNSIFQQEKYYTNVENGKGIFASRYYTVLRSYLEYNSRKELITGKLNGKTGGLGFCEPLVQFDPNHCP